MENISNLTEWGNVCKTVSKSQAARSPCLTAGMTLCQNPSCERAHTHAGSCLAYSSSDLIFDFLKTTFSLGTAKIYRVSNWGRLPGLTHPSITASRTAVALPNGGELWKRSRDPSVCSAVRPHSHTGKKSSKRVSLGSGTDWRWNYTFFRTHTANPCMHTGRVIHLMPKNPGIIISSWRVVMKSLHNMERFINDSPATVEIKHPAVCHWQAAQSRGST